MRTSSGEGEALDEQHAHELEPACAERGSNRDLTAA
jgi:hypothetical protein